MGADPITAAVVGGALGLIGSGGDIKGAILGAGLGYLGGGGFGGAESAAAGMGGGSGIAAGSAGLGIGGGSTLANSMNLIGFGANSLAPSVMGLSGVGAAAGGLGALGLAGGMPGLSQAAFGDIASLSDAGLGSLASNGGFGTGVGMDWGGALGKEIATHSLAPGLDAVGGAPFNSAAWSNMGSAGGYAPVTDAMRTYVPGGESFQFEGNPLGSGLDAASAKLDQFMSPNNLMKQGLKQGVKYATNSVMAPDQQVRQVGSSYAPATVSGLRPGTLDTQGIQRNARATGALGMVRSATPTWH